MEIDKLYSLSWFIPRILNENVLLIQYFCLKWTNNLASPFQLYNIIYHFENGQQKTKKKLRFMKLLFKDVYPTKALSVLCVCKTHVNSSATGDIW